MHAQPAPADTAADEAYREAMQATRAGDEPRALTMLAQALARFPSRPHLWQAKGLAHRSLEQSEEAAAAFAQAARLSPADALIAHSLARTTLEAGRSATALFARARELAPADAAVLLGEAAALHAEPTPHQACALLDHALRSAPGWVEGHATLARLRAMTGAPDRIGESYARATCAEPRNAQLWNGFVTTLLRAGDHDGAAGALARARAALGPGAMIDALAAMLAAERGDAGEADRLFAALAPIGDIGLLVYRLRHLLRNGRADTALAEAELHRANDAAGLLWPYLALGWRLTGDARAQWLEGDDRLVASFDIADAAGPLDPLAERLRAIHVAVAQPLDQSLRGGTQTDGPLFARAEPEIRRLRAAVVDAVERYVAALPPPDAAHPLLGQPRDRRVRFAGSWSVRLTDRGHHVDHVHPAGWISSACYVALPEGAMGGPEHAGWLALGTSRELTPALPPARLIEPKPGRLMLFPSWMWHGTLPFAAGERLTVAFDVARPYGPPA